ncbi:MAG: SDR family oxidoreductase [Novosphingobium sp.]|nr:SDR family oxidoreductase [Novosphingobium sp.]
MMRVLVLGAGGFIGRHIVTRLLAEGHAVTGTARSIAGLEAAMPGARFVQIDLAKAVEPEHWHGLLNGIDVVVNAAGVLRGPEMEAIHVAMPGALIAAASSVGLQRVILVSAISARADVPTDYAQSKLRGEQVLRASGLAWTILRPSLVYAEGSYGGTSLLRGLAALPFAVPVPAGEGYEFSPIHVDDLAETVARVTAGPGFAGQTLEPCGPETLSHREILKRYRAWLGFGRTRYLALPLPLMQVIARLGDLWREGPVSSVSLNQLIAGNAGDGAAFSSAVGTSPRSMANALRDQPAQVQDRWHARLYFLAPTIRCVLALLWLVSAWLGLTQGAEQTHDVVRSLALPSGFEDPLRIGASLADAGLAALVLFNRKGRWATWAQLAVIGGYTAVIGWALPGLWLDPLGPLLKNLPILALVLVHGAIADSR